MRIIAVLASMAIAALLGPADGAVLNGRVIKAQDATPLRRVRVEVRTVGEGPTHAVTTDRDGTFRVVGLPAGHYVVRVRADGYWQSPEDRTTVVALDDTTAASVVIRMQRGGVITGRVIDHAGAPAGDVPVYALVSEFRSGREVLRQLSPRLTDDHGIFRLFGLDPGTYYVASSPGQARDLLGAPRRERVVTYYPATIAASEAQSIIVAGDRDISIGDLEIRPVTTATLDGFVFTARGLPASEIEVLMIPATGPMLTDLPSMTTRADGSFSFVDVPPGQYQFQNLPGDPPEFGSSTVVLGPGANTATVNMLRPRALRARIIVDDGAPDFAPSLLQFHLVPADRSASPVARGAKARTLDDWTVEITNVWGPQYLSLRAGPPHWMLKQVREAGVDRTSSPIDFASAAELTIMLSRRTARVTGVVVDYDRRRMSGANVLIFASDPDEWSDARRIRLVRTGTDGTFDADAFPSGRYLLSARIAFEENGDWPPRPSTLESLRAGSTEVNMIEGRSTNVQLTATHAVR